MKIAIELMLQQEPPAPAPAKEPEKGPSVDERIEYASECIECGHQKAEALAFIQNLYNKLSKIPSPKKGDQKRLGFMRSIIENYGMLMPESEKSDG